MAGLPFVRMVAITGSLAWDNVDGSSDIDYLFVTEPGRVWLCRLFLAAVARIARRSGVELCINYVLSERALALAERDLYTACELVRMTPIAGLPVYRQMRVLNDWTKTYLPNAVEGRPETTAEVPSVRNGLARLLVWVARASEWVFRSWVGAVFERLEMKYRLHRILSQGPHDQTEMLFTSECFKAHPNGRRRRTLTAFWQRVQGLRAS